MRSYQATGANVRELAGADALPAIIREMDDDAAVILLVGSNIQREEILPSERALALKTFGEYAG